MYLDDGASLNQTITNRRFAQLYTKIFEFFSIVLNDNDENDGYGSGLGGCGGCCY